MERRKVWLDDEQPDPYLEGIMKHREPQQQELSLSASSNRRRIVTFEEGDKVPAPGTATPTPPPRLRAGWTEAALHHFEDAKLLTDWASTAPESNGWWEVKQKSARAPDPHNWWYHAPSRKWFRGVPQKDSRLAGAIPHEQFAQSHVWRGFKQPWTGGYNYELEKTPFGTPIIIGSEKVTILKGEDVLAPAEVIPSYPDLNPNKAQERRRIEL